MSLKSWDPISLGQISRRDDLGHRACVSSAGPNTARPVSQMVAPMNSPSCHVWEFPSATSPVLEIKLNQWGSLCEALSLRPSVPAPLSPLQPSLRGCSPVPLPLLHFFCYKPWTPCPPDPPALSSPGVCTERSQQQQMKTTTNPGGNEHLRDYKRQQGAIDKSLAFRPNCWFSYPLDSALQFSNLKMGYNSIYLMGLLEVLNEWMDIKCLNSAWHVVSAMRGVDVLLPCWCIYICPQKVLE